MRERERDTVFTPCVNKAQVKAAGKRLSTWPQSLHRPLVPKLTSAKAHRQQSQLTDNSGRRGKVGDSNEDAQLRPKISTSLATSTPSSSL